MDAGGHGKIKKRSNMVGDIFGSWERPFNEQKQISDRQPVIIHGVESVLAISERPAMEGKNGHLTSAAELPNKFGSLGPSIP